MDVGHVLSAAAGAIFGAVVGVFGSWLALKESVAVHQTQIANLAESVRLLRETVANLDRHVWDIAGHPQRGQPPPGPGQV